MFVYVFFESYAIIFTKKREILLCSTKLFFTSHSWGIIVTSKSEIK